MTHDKLIGLGLIALAAAIIVILLAWRLARWLDERGDDDDLDTEAGFYPRLDPAGTRVDAMPAVPGPDAGLADRAGLPPADSAPGGWQPAPGDRIAQWAGRDLYVTDPDLAPILDKEWFLDQMWKADNWAIDAPERIERLAADFYRHPELMPARYELEAVTRKLEPVS